MKTIRLKSIGSHGKTVSMPLLRLERCRGIFVVSSAGHVGKSILTHIFSEIVLEQKIRYRRFFGSRALFLSKFFLGSNVALPLYDMSKDSYALQALAWEEEINSIPLSVSMLDYLGSCFWIMIDAICLRRDFAVVNFRLSKQKVVGSTPVTANIRDVSNIDGEGVITYFDLLEDIDQRHCNNGLVRVVSKISLFLKRFFLSSTTLKAM